MLTTVSCPPSVSRWRLTLVNPSFASHSFPSIPFQRLYPSFSPMLCRSAILSHPVPPVQPLCPLSHCLYNKLSLSLSAFSHLPCSFSLLSLTLCLLTYSPNICLQSPPSPLPLSYPPPPPSPSLTPLPIQTMPVHFPSLPCLPTTPLYTPVSATHHCNDPTLSLSPYTPTHTVCTRCRGVKEGCVVMLSVTSPRRSLNT